MDPIQFAAFVDELQLIQKEAGALGDVWQGVKRVAMTDIGGPAGVLKPAETIAQHVKSPGKATAAFKNFDMDKARAAADARMARRASGAAPAFSV